MEDIDYLEQTSCAGILEYFRIRRISFHWDVYMFLSERDVRKKYWCVYSIEGECYLKIFQQFSIYFKGKQFSQPEDRLFSSSQMRKVFPSKSFFFLLRQDRKYLNKAWWPETCENTKNQVTEEWILNNNEEQDSNEQCSIMRHGSIL